MIYNQIIKYYAIKNDISVEESEILHQKLELFLDECVISEKPLIPTIEVDVVWHSFILHTKLYAKFCIEKYGHFIHHNPHLPKSNIGCSGGIEDECDAANCDAAKYGKVVALKASADCSDNCSSCDSQFTK